ncbi:ABC transporter ATP-binding protein [Agromyces allii]|uniref:ATP-binding cassette domain-containing protein n=1 Tax=Agromyces allii TaxID=393607 RepID=A0ABP5CGX7_9MICO|nr:ABC transporter ATP-binding protein [Agromyces allii]
MTESTPLLRVRDAEVTYKGRGRSSKPAVRGVSLDVHPGEIVGIVGESGCGKSSLARAMVGLQATSGGSIEFLGERVRPLPIRRRAASMIPLQMVFQDPNASLNPRRRVDEQIGEVIRGSRRAMHDPARSKAEVDALVADALDRVGLDPALRRRYPHALSGGQRQRVAIAKVLAVDTKVIIADEPIASLDASSQKRVGALLRDLVDTMGIGMAIISHDLAVVASIADTMAVMRAGEFVEKGTAEQLWTHARQPYTRELLGAVPSLVSRAA